jgi:D-alanine-D-alanine ligase
MHIGLTFDLRSDYLAQGYSEEDTAEFDRDDTVVALETALDALGHTTTRIGSIRALVTRLAASERWDLVFNICEGMFGFGRESQVPAVLDAYEIPYTFSDPLVMAACLHKAHTKILVAHHGIRTPQFAVVTDATDARTAPVTFPAFAKPIAEGTGKGVTPSCRVERREDLEALCADLLRRYRQPVLVETYLPGREVTVSILGTGADASVLGTLEIVLRPDAEPGVYSYVNKEQCESLVDYRPVSASDPAVAEAEAMALAAWRALDCRDAGRIDLRADADGRMHFLEANPLAGMHPEHSDLPMQATAVGLPYVELVGRIVESASARVRRT